MSYAIGKPIVSANIVIGETETEIAIGDSVSGMVVVGGTGLYEVSGDVVAISLGRKETNGYLGPIFDGVPTFKFESDDTANIHNAADYFEVDFLMIEVAAAEEGGKPTYVKVPVNKIKAMSGGLEGINTPSTPSTDSEKPGVGGGDPTEDGDNGDDTI